MIIEIYTGALELTWGEARWPALQKHHPTIEPKKKLSPT